MITFYICCPGPSLHWDWLDVEQHPLICINMAIIDAPRCDYWCCIDRPNKVHFPCKDDYERLRPVVVTKKKRYKPWREFLGEGAKLVNCYSPEYISGWVNRADTGASLSMITALGFAVANGATRVVFHGVDLEGLDYGRFGNPKEREESCWNKRWPKEIRAMSVLLKDSRQNGVELVGLPEVVTNIGSCEPLPQGKLKWR